MECVFDEGARVGHAEEAGIVGLVLGKQQVGRPAVGAGAGGEAQAAERGVLGDDEGVASPGDARLGPIAFAAASPRPGVAEPQGGEEVQRRRPGPAVVRSDAAKDVVGRGLGVFDKDVEILVAVENAGVVELVLAVLLAAASVLGHEVGVGELALRVFVEGLEVGMRGRRVQVEIVLLDVLAVVPLGSGHAEQPLLEDGVAFVPQRDGEAQAALAIGNAQQAVLAPAVSAAARLVMGEVVPAVATFGIVLAHRSPLALG